MAHFLGGLSHVLGRYDEADAYFARAAALCERVGAKFFAARTDLAWARTLLARDATGDHARAHELLACAMSSAETNGYEVVARRAAAFSRQ